jgi:exosortase family protein XrtF
VVPSPSDKRIKIPRSVTLFFIKALVLFIIWKAVYLSFLLPKRILDEPLTNSVGVATTRLLNLFSGVDQYSTKQGIGSIEVDGKEQPVSQMDIYKNNEKTLGIADVCNGLELLVLYVGFIICFPSPVSRKLLFAAIGFALIYLLNLFRCAALVMIFIHYREYLDFSHHFAFTFIVYAFIFLLWYIFTKNLRLNAQPA